MSLDHSDSINKSGKKDGEESCNILPSCSLWNNINDISQRSQAEPQFLVTPHKGEDDVHDMEKANHSEKNKDEKSIIEKEWDYFVLSFFRNNPSVNLKNNIPIFIYFQG